MKMKEILLTICVLFTAQCLSAEAKVKIMGRVTTLNESILGSARQQYQTESCPGAASVVPKEIQLRVLDLIGLNNALNEVSCKSLRFVKVLPLQKSDDLRFGSDTIAQGYFNEIWVFDSCDQELRFQVGGTHKGKKLEKIIVIQTNNADLVTGERLKQAFSF